MNLDQQYQRVIDAQVYLQNAKTEMYRASTLPSYALDLFQALEAIVEYTVALQRDYKVLIKRVIAAPVAPSPPRIGDKPFATVAIYRAEEGGFVVSATDRPGCVTQCDTAAEIGPMILDAIEGWDDSYRVAVGRERASGPDGDETEEA